MEWYSDVVLPMRLKQRAVFEFSTAERVNPFELHRCLHADYGTDFFDRGHRLKFRESEIGKSKIADEPRRGRLSATDENHLKLVDKGQGQVEADGNTVLKYANSYQLDSKNKFCAEKVEHILRELLEQSVAKDTKYDAVESPKLALKLSSQLRERVKELQFDRYKLVCVIQISEKAGQGLLTLSQALWDENRDSCALFSFENYHLTISAAVYAFYCE